MRHKMIRTALATAVLATCSVGAAPSHAGPADGWVLIDSGQLAHADGTVDALVTLVLGAVGAAKDRVCTPGSSTISVGSLRWQRYWNPSTLATAFEWIGPGAASLSDDKCAERLELTVEVTDTAPAGHPPAVQGDPGRSEDRSGSGGQFSAYAESRAFVVYYDPLNLAYQRGPSAVEIKVSASYYNRKAKAMVPLGCKRTHTFIQPSPNGPSGTTGPVEDCGA